MGSYFGKEIHISIFGQSHAECIGVTIDGLPAGEAVDEEALRAFMLRRAPGRSAESTARREADEPHIICGLHNGRTCGAPLTAIIKNGDTRSKDYDKLRDLPRPGHADLTAEIKYRGFQDGRGGGHFSGRLTGPLCVAGGIALHRFIIVTVEVDAVMFGRDVAPLSFVYAVALTLLFSTIVNLVMQRSLKKISMVESMKAPE